MPKKNRKTARIKAVEPAPAIDRIQDTPMAEAIAFISAVLCAPYDCAQGNSLYWTLPYPRTGEIGYPVGVTFIDDRTLRVLVDLDALSSEAPPSALNQIYSIIGWAASHGHSVLHGGTILFR